jgi:hypothetical protein
MLSTLIFTGKTDNLGDNYLVQDHYSEGLELEMMSAESEPLVPFYFVASLSCKPFLEKQVSELFRRVRCAYTIILLIPLFFFFFVKWLFFPILLHHYSEL